IISFARTGTDGAVVTLTAFAVLTLSPTTPRVARALRQPQLPRRRPMVSVRMVGLVILVALMLPTTVLAVGPVCWTMSPPGDLFRLFFHLDPSDPETVTVVGTTALDPS